MCAMLLLTVPNGCIAEQLWDLEEQHVLASSNHQSTFGRLEILASENCAAIELRLWAEISDAGIGTLGEAHTIDLRFLLADMQIASQGHLLDVYQGIIDDTGLVYVRLGYWDWSVVDHLPDQSKHTHFSLLTDSYEIASNNTWPVGNLSDQLTKLKLNCDDDLLGIML